MTRAQQGSSRRLDKTRNREFLLELMKLLWSPRGPARHFRPGGTLGEQRKADADQASARAWPN